MWMWPLQTYVVLHYLVRSSCPIGIKCLRGSSYTCLLSLVLMILALKLLASAEANNLLLFCVSLRLGRHIRRGNFNIPLLKKAITLMYIVYL
jgi:hypothetical protein